MEKTNHPGRSGSLEGGRCPGQKRERAPSPARPIALSALVPAFLVTLLILLEASTLVLGHRAEAADQQLWTQYMEAQLHRSRREYAEAIARFRQVYEADPTNASVALELAWTYFEAGEADSALAMASRVAEQEQESAEASVLAGRSYLALNKPSKARPWLQRALDLDPEDTWVRMNLLMIYENMNRPLNALEMLEPEIPEDIATSRMYFRRAELRFQVGRVLDGLGDLARILRLEPEYPRVIERFVQVVSSLEDPTIALPLIDSLLAGRPELTHLRRTAINVLAQSDRWREALPHLRVLSEQDPEDGRVRLQTALLLLRAGTNGAAEDELEAAARIDPADPEPYRWLWRIATEREDWSQAVALADSILVREPEDLDAKWFRALASYRSGNRDEAMQWLDQVLRANPAFREAALLASALLQDEGRFDEAEQHLDRYLQEEPEDLLPRFRLGVVLERSGEFEAAQAAFDRLLAMEPDHHPSLNYSGYMWIERGENLPEALRRVRRALELDPGNPAYEDSYGWGLFQMGRPQEAIDPLKRAVGGDSTNVIIVKHLGKAYEESGRAREALEIYQTALELDPSDSEAKSWLEGLRERLSRNSSPPRR